MRSFDATLRSEFAVLGLPPDADRLAVVGAYRRLVRERHPDRSNAPDAAVRFSELCAAYHRILHMFDRERIVRPISEHAENVSLTGSRMAEPWIVPGPVTVSPPTERLDG